WILFCIIQQKFSSHMLSKFIFGLEIIVTNVTWAASTISTGQSLFINIFKTRPFSSNLEKRSVLEKKTIPENLPTPAGKYKLKHRQHEADMKEEYKQNSERNAENKRNHRQCPEASVKVLAK
ncbi:hypothetical protein ASZ78_012865, partial [Callipepla squamata]